MPVAQDDNPYTRLAYAARQGRAHLRADELLPGDVIELDGGEWTLQASVVFEQAVRLVLCPGRWEPEVERDLQVRVLR